MDEGTSASLPLKGCYITFTGFTHNGTDTNNDPNDGNTASLHTLNSSLVFCQQLARNLGAVVEAHITKRCSVVIAAQGLTQKRLLAERHGIPVVLPSWLTYIQTHSTSTTTSNSAKAGLEPHVCAQFAVPLCYGYCFTTSGLSLEEKAALTSILTKSHGARLEAALTPECDAVLVTPEWAHALRQQSTRKSNVKYLALRQTQEEEDTTTRNAAMNSNGSAYVTEKIRFAWAEGIPVIDFHRLLSLARLDPNAAQTSSIIATGNTSRVDFDTIVDMCAIPAPVVQTSNTTAMQAHNKASNSNRTEVNFKEAECDELECDDDEESAEEAGCSPPSTYVDYFSAPLSLPVVQQHKQQQRTGMPMPRGLSLTPFCLQREGFLVLTLMGCNSTELRDATRMCVACRFLRQPLPTTWTDIVVLGSELVVRKRQARRTTHNTISTTNKVAGSRSPPVTLRGCSALHLQEDINNKKSGPQQATTTTTLTKSSSKSSARQLRTWYECTDAQLPAWLESCYGIAAARLVPLTWLQECFRRVQAKHARTTSNNRTSYNAPAWLDTLSSLPESSRPGNAYDADTCATNTQEHHGGVFDAQCPLALDELPNPAEPNYTIHVKPASYASPLTALQGAAEESIGMSKVQQQQQVNDKENVNAKAKRPSTLEPRKASGQPTTTTSSNAPVGPAPSVVSITRSDATNEALQQQQRYEYEKQQAKLKLQQLLQLLQPVSPTLSTITTSSVTPTVFQHCCMCFIEGKFARTELAVVRGLVNYGAGKWLKRSAEEWTALLRSSRKRPTHPGSSTTTATTQSITGEEQNASGVTEGDNSGDEDTPLMQRVRRHILWRKAQRTTVSSSDDSNIKALSSMCVRAPVLYVLPHYYQRATDRPATSTTAKAANSERGHTQQGTSSARNTQSTAGSTQTTSHTTMKAKQYPLRHLVSITHDYLLACLACSRMLDPRRCFLFHTALCNAPDMLLLHHHHHSITRKIQQKDNTASSSDSMPALSRWVWERRYRKSESVGVCVSFVWRLPQKYITHSPKVSSSVFQSDDKGTSVKDTDTPSDEAMALMRVLQHGFSSAVQALGGTVRDRYSGDAVTHVVLVDVAAILASSLEAALRNESNKGNDTAVNIDECVTVWPAEDLLYAQEMASKDECALCRLEWLAACVAWGIFVDERLTCYQLKTSDLQGIIQQQPVTPEPSVKTHEEKQATPHTPHSERRGRSHNTHTGSAARALSLTRRLQGPRGALVTSPPAHTTSNSTTPQRPVENVLKDTSSNRRVGDAALLSVGKLFHFHPPGATPMPERTTTTVTENNRCKDMNSPVVQEEKEQQQIYINEANIVEDPVAVHRPLLFGAETSVCTPPTSPMGTTQDALLPESSHNNTISHVAQEKALLGGSPSSTDKNSEQLKVNDTVHDVKQRKRPRQPSRLHSPCSASCPSFQSKPKTLEHTHDNEEAVLPPHAHTMTGPMRCWNPLRQTSQPLPCIGEISASVAVHNDAEAITRNDASQISAHTTNGVGGVYARVLRQSPDAEHAVCVVPTSWTNVEANNQASPSSSTEQHDEDNKKGAGCHEVIDVEAFVTESVSEEKDVIPRPIALLARTSPSPPPQIQQLQLQGNALANSCTNNSRAGVKVTRSAPPPQRSARIETLRVYVLHDVPNRTALLQRCQDALRHLLPSQTHSSSPYSIEGESVKDRASQHVPVRFVDRCEEAEVVVTAELSPRESVLCACAAGLWLVRPSFLTRIYSVLTQYTRHETCRGQAQVLWWAELMARLRQVVAETEWTRDDVASDNALNSTAGGTLRMQRQLAIQCRRRRTARELHGWRVFMHRGFVLCFSTPTTTNTTSSSEAESIRQRRVAAVRRLVTAGGGVVCATLQLQHTQPTTTTLDTKRHQLRYFADITNNSTRRDTSSVNTSPTDTLDGAVLFEDMAHVLCNALVHPQSKEVTTSHTAPVQELVMLFDTSLLTTIRVTRPSHNTGHSNNECNEASCTLQEWLEQDFACGSRLRALRYYLTRARTEAHTHNNTNSTSVVHGTSHDAYNVHALSQPLCAPLALQSRDEYDWWQSEEPRLRSLYASFVYSDEEDITRSKALCWAELKAVSIKPMSWLAYEVSGHEAMNGAETQGDTVVVDLISFTLS